MSFGRLCECLRSVCRKPRPAQHAGGSQERLFSRYSPLLSHIPQASLAHTKQAKAVLEALRSDTLSEQDPGPLGTIKAQETALP